jgi:hypothetical protein
LRFFKEVTDELEFENLSGDESIDWLATGIAESLATDLRKLQVVRVASSDRVRAARQQTNEAEPSRSDVDYGLLGKRMGADWVVTGSWALSSGTNGVRFTSSPQYSSGICTSLWLVKRLSTHYHTRPPDLEVYSLM